MAEQVNETAKELVNNASEVANNATNTIADIAKSGVNTVNETIEKTINSSGTLIGLIFVVIVAIISSFILYWFIVSKVFNKESIVIEKTKIPIKGFTRTEVPIQSFPMSKNGFKKTYTFWIYLDNMNTGKDMYKHVFHIGNTDSTITSSSPIVFIGKNKNSLHIRFAKSDVSKDTYTMISGNENVKLSNLSSDDKFIKYMEQGVTIDYLPMQRWVHVAIVVNETLTNGSGGMIHTYLDSELTSTTTTNIGLTLESGEHKKDLDNLELDKMGTLIVGGTGKSTEDFGFNGLLSKVKIFNYDLNSRDIYNDYSNGPIDGFLHSLGYGIRTPIYKLADI